MKNRFVSLINRNNRRVIHPPPWNRFISNIFSGRLENPIGEKYVSRSMLDHPWFLRWFSLRIVLRYRESNRVQLANLFIRSFFFSKNWWKVSQKYITLDRISRELSHFLRSCLFQDPFSTLKISSTPRSVDEHGSFDRRVCNSNRSSVAGTIFNETSVTFAYRDIQFCEAAKNKGSRRRKEAEVAVGGHAIK